MEWKSWQVVAVGGVGLTLGFALGATVNDDVQVSSIRPSSSQVSTTPAPTVTTVPPTQPVTSQIPDTLPPATQSPVTQSPVTQPPRTQSSTTAVPGPQTTFGNGTFRVGVDIAPGDYRSAGPVGDDPYCYWEREATFDGDFDSVIANGNEQGPIVVTVSASDAGFKSVSCQPWTPA